MSNDRGHALVERNDQDSPYCMFCTQRGQAFAKLTSTSPMRTQIVRVCASCALIIEGGLKDLLNTGSPRLSTP
jgi:hypothetical protein